MARLTATAKFAKAKIRHADNVFWTKLRQREVEVSPEVLRAREDFPYFCWYMTRALPVEHQKILQPHHLEWVKELVTGDSNSTLKGIAGEDLNILASRGAAKSTVLGFFCAWAIGNHALVKIPFKILYVSSSIEIAAPRSVAIQRLVDSPEFREIFPCVRKGKKWNESYWSIDHEFAGIPTLGEEEFTLVAAGITGSIVSKRASLIVFDDLIKSMEQIANPSVREKMVQTYSNSIVPCLFPGGRKISVGTRYHAADIHATTFTGDRGWRVIEQQAILSLTFSCVKRPGSVIETRTIEYSYWPGRFTLEYLKQLREEDPLAFSFQYQNKIKRVTDVSVPLDCIRFLPSPPLRRGVVQSFHLGLDLAASKAQAADYSAFILAATFTRDAERTYFPPPTLPPELVHSEASRLTDSENFEFDAELQPSSSKETYRRSYPVVYFIDYIRVKISGNIEKIRNINMLLDDYVEDEKLPANLYVEGSGYQVSLKGDWQQFGRSGVRVKQVSRRGDKLLHLRGVLGYFETHRVYFNPMVDWQPVTDELTNFLSTSHDDCADAAINTLWGVGALPRLRAV